MLFLVRFKRHVSDGQFAVRADSPEDAAIQFVRSRLSPNNAEIEVLVDIEWRSFTVEHKITWRVK